MKKTSSKASRTTELAQMKCTACQDGGSRLRGADLRKIARALGHQWKVVKSHHVEKEFKFKDFKTALAYTNRVGALAEQQGHHPDIYVAWGKVKVTIWTHSAGGLTESDFVLAAKIEKIKRA